MSKSNAHLNDNPVTVVGFTQIVHILVLIVPPALGLILGYFIPSIAKWAIQLPWIPFQGPLELIAHFHENWVVFVTTILGLIAGIWLSVEVMKDSLVITVSDDKVSLKIKGTVQNISRVDVASAFIDGKKVVLLGSTGNELARETYESAPADVARAFVKHDYPWLPTGDPYDGDYRLWVPETPELPPAVNALLKAREQALQKKDAEAAKEMYREASRIGIVIRNKGMLQYWRQVANGTEGVKR
ncbi:YqeB family protein [Brevibacillus choshinensis]|uniref:YqeB family protein n=1 Tax=Brevibacillus choshinensis TaxID=54911 RepID=UPI000AE970AA|nr:DUF308 domain-containing protein [Brevibacillus choshinensis]